MFVKNVKVYSESTKSFGQVVGYNPENNNVLIYDNMKKETISLKESEVIVMEQIGTLDGQEVFEYDVLFDKQNGEKVWAVLTPTGQIIMERVNSNYDSDGAFKQITLQEMQVGLRGMELLGNRFELKALAEQVDLDFNLKIVYDKLTDSYKYIGNNKKMRTVDVIKVIFVGSTVLEEESYERFTFSYEEYITLIKSGSYVESSPSELNRHVQALMNKPKKQVVQVDEPTEDLECGVSCGCVDVCAIDEDEYTEKDVSIEDSISQFFTNLKKIIEENGE